MKRILFTILTILLTGTVAINCTAITKDNSLNPKPASSEPTPKAAASSEPNTATSTLNVQGISIGQTVDTIVKSLGQPARKDPGEYQLQWYIYNQNYNNYIQIGIRDNKVAALYTSSPNWSTANGKIKDGVSRGDVVKLYGQPLTSITKGNTRFTINYGDNEYGTYEIDGAFITFFYDLHLNDLVTGIQVIEKTTELSQTDFYPQSSPELALAFERQIFDLANATRTKMKLSTFTWNDALSVTARKHSQDMSDQDYFSHTNLTGQSPFDRMDQDGIKYRSAAENIATGQTSAIFAHQGWMNSEGHRKNLLGNFTHLSVGVAFGGSMHINYTQNFMTP